MLQIWLRTVPIAGVTLPSFTSRASALSSFLSSSISRVAGECAATPPARALRRLCSTLASSCDQQTFLPGGVGFWHGLPYWVVDRHVPGRGRGGPSAGPPSIFFAPCSN